MPAAGEAADDIRPGRDRAQVVVEHGHELAHREAGTGRRALRVEHAAGGAGLGRAEAVQHHRVRELGAQLVLDGGGEDRPTRPDDDHGRGVVRRAGRGERFGERTTHRIAHDHHRVATLPFDGAPDAVGVEVAIAVEHDGAATVEVDERHPLAAAVHHRGVHHGDGAGVLGRDPLGELLRLRDRRLSEAAAAEGGEEDVLRPPHDALRDAGGAARIEKVEVVGGARLEVTHRRRRRQCVLVGGGVCIGVAAVLEDNGVTELGEVGANHCEQRAERPLVHDDDRVRVVEDVARLVGDVAVVDVDRDGACLVRAEHRLDPFGAVPGVDRDLVARLDTVVEEMMGEAVGALVELGVGEAPVAGDERRPVRHRVGHDLVEVGEVELHAGAK